MKILYEGSLAINNCISNYNILYELLLSI